MVGTVILDIGRMPECGSRENRPCRAELVPGLGWHKAATERQVDAHHRAVSETTDFRSGLCVGFYVLVGDRKVIKVTR